MGMITVSVQGSFGKKNGTKTFSAIDHGHADAVAQAIQFLSGDILPFATGLDHEIHAEGDRPRNGFTRAI